MKCKSRRKNVEEQILCILLDGKMRYTKIIDILDRPDKTVYVNLKKLIERNLVVKLDRGLYGLTDGGMERAEVTSLDKQTEIRGAKLWEWINAPELENKIIRELHVAGFAIDMQKPNSVMGVMANGGVLALMDPIETFPSLSDLEEEYLTFLSNLYTSSPLKYRGTEPSHWLHLKLAWSEASTTAWKKREKRKGFDFWFPGAWESLEKERSGKLKKRMAEFSLDRFGIFRSLWLFSFSPLERFVILKDRRKVVEPLHKGGLS